MFERCLACISHQNFTYLRDTKKLRAVFGQIPDFRRSHENFMILGIISVICGAVTWDEMEDYAYSKEGFCALS